MHELALAQAVVDAAVAAAEKEGLCRITRIEVRVGELQRIEPETFEFALREMMPAAEPRIRGAEIRLAVTPARFHCRACGRDFGLAEARGPGDGDAAEAIHFVPELAHAFLQCPGCGGPDYEFLEGRGVMLEAVEGE